MRPEDEYFVSTCSHLDESAEQDASGTRRTALFRRGAHSCMLNASPHQSSRQWRSIVSLTFF